MKAALAWLALLLAAWAGAAHGGDGRWPAAPGSELEVSLLTFGPGEEVWERFGHNAIRIRDGTTGLDVAYNYGIFDFDEADFALNFARGVMRYRIQADYTAEDLPLYTQEGRWIVEQRLNLSPTQRIELKQFLDWNRRPENAKYRYDYYVSNCSTRVRDALDEHALGGAIRRALVGVSKGYTYRLHTDILMSPEPLLMYPMDFGLGPYADRRLSAWDESFVPMEFMAHLRQVKVRDADGNEVPLVASEATLAQGRLPDPSPPGRWQRPLALAFGLALGIGLYQLARRRASASARRTLALSGVLLHLLFGVAGTLLLALWLLTEHQSAWRNESLLLANPLSLLLLPAWWNAWRADAQRSRFATAVATVVAGAAVLALVVKVLPWFAQDNGLWLRVLVPLQLGLYLGLRRLPARER